MTRTSRLVPTLLMAIAVLELVGHEPIAGAVLALAAAVWVR
jgi:hypothetical protein